MTPTIFVVDDDRDFRESLVWLLEASDLQVLAFDSAEQFLASYPHHQHSQQPACLLLDVRMAGMSGLALQQEMLRRHWQLPTIVITGHGDVPMAVQAMKNQAVDFIEKPFDDEQLLHAIETALQHKPTTAKTQPPAELLARWQQLSKRERQVALLVKNGAATRTIAEQLGIAVKTVEIHRSRVLSKMAVARSADLIGLLAGFPDSCFVE